MQVFFENFCEENGIHHNFFPQEHLNKMVLWRGKIDPLTKELEFF